MKKLKRVIGKSDTVLMRIDKIKTPEIIKMVKSDETRKKLDLMLDNIAKEINIPILNMLIKKRD